MSAAPKYAAADYLKKWAEVEDASAELDGLSPADELALCEEIEPGSTAKLLEELLEQFGPNGWQLLAFEPRFWLREKQRAIFDFSSYICLVIGGRGGGKTRPAVEWIISRIERGARVITFVAPTMADIEQYMLGGNKKRSDGFNGSGLFDCLPPWLPYHYKQDLGQIHFPTLGVVIYLHSAEVPEYRGPEPDTVWGDELLKWRYGEKIVSNLRLACRARGKLPPQLLFTTSPKRLQWLRDLVMDPDVETVTSSTEENRGNTDPGWVDREYRRLSGTRQGAEELEGKLGLDDESDMFKLSLIDELRVLVAPSFDELCVAVDPAGSDKRRADMTGISLCGRVGSVAEGHGYVLEDLSDKYIWEGWGAAVVKLAIDRGASSIAMENNKFAGAVISNIRMCAQALGWETQIRPGSKTLQDLVGPNGRRIQLVEVNAHTDKVTRAGPVSTMLEKKRLHHVGHHPELQIELGDFPNNSSSPNRVDAKVHAITKLFRLDCVAQEAPNAKPTEIAKANAQLDRSAPNHGAQRLPMGHYRGRVI